MFEKYIAAFHVYLLTVTQTKKKLGQIMNNKSSYSMLIENVTKNSKKIIVPLKEKNKF